jgi:glutaredoxin
MVQIALVLRLASVILLTWSCCAVAQLYRWTDESGRTHFTDTPPPPSARNVQKKAVPAAPAAAAEPFALQQARKNYPVTLYTAPGCDICGDARELLNARGIPFAEISVTQNTQIEELKKVAGSNTVPALLVGVNPLKGFDAATYHQVLDAAGYPKTGALAPRSQAEPKPAAEPKIELKPTPP